MKKLILFFSIIMLSLSSCSYVPSGYVGVKLYLYGRDKGVDYDVLSPGKYFVGFNEEMFLFPTVRITKVWTNSKTEDSPIAEGFEFQSKEGMKLTANVGIEFHIEKQDIPEIFQLYRAGCVEITNNVLRNVVRESFNFCASTRTAEQMYGEGKVQFMTDVRDLVCKMASEKKITVDNVYLLGNMGVPDEVTTALNAKITAKQKAEQAENELRQTEAEAKKAEAAAEGRARARIVEAEAEAKANILISSSITSTLVEYEKIKRWDGKVSQVSGGNALINLK